MSFQKSRLFDSSSSYSECGKYFSPLLLQEEALKKMMMRPVLVVGWRGERSWRRHLNA